jgi:ABC-type phosphate transport system substrate-binding protein
VAGLVALSLATLAAVVLAPSASAAFTTTKCAGPDIVGRGASFARDAHKVFNSNFKSFYCIGTSGFGKRNVTYQPEGSGSGKSSVKTREDVPRFGMSDEPPPPDEIAQMNAGTGSEPAGTDTNPNDNGKIHVIPAAVGAVAPLVNFPNGCDVNELPASAKTEEHDFDENTTPDGTVRVRFNRTQFENVWAKDGASDEWHEVFPDLAGDADCEVPIIRVVRFDTSGTTYAFKDYLNSIDGGEGWLTTYIANEENRQWPGGEVGKRSDCAEKVGPGAQADAIDHLTSGCGSGNDDLVAKLVEVDGSIGYSDISTARANTPSLAIEAEAGDNDTYWTQVENAAEEWVEPTAFEEGVLLGGPKGANCQATEFENVPATTFDDWSKATGVSSEVGFGICTMTYGLVFDDNADVWGNTPGEEAKARTVKDYWENIVSEGTQNLLFGNDYAPLPPSVIGIARAGVASIDWNKGEGTGKGGGTTPPPVSTTPITTPPPVVTPPSSKFSLLKKAISSKTGKATISVKLPGAGKLVMVGTAKNGKKSIRVGKVTLNANKAGTFKLTLKPGGAAKKVLRKKGRLKVSLRLTFTPKGGSATASRSAVTLKLKKKSKRK